MSSILLYNDTREALVRDLIERRGVSNPHVLAAMRTIPCHHPGGLRASAWAIWLAGIIP